MKLSLACIAGNAEKYIERFLDSFQPWFDEVVIVRAVGSLEPDRTLEIAESRGCVVGEYLNAKTASKWDFEGKVFEWADKNWPHVDDFAAARNMAFDLATGDWIMWADMDDILQGGEHIRADLEAMPAEARALSAPYDIRDDQLRVMRERIIRKGETRWINPIHENLDFPDGVKCVETNRWQVVHMPLGTRKANDERNLRILESIPNPNGSQRFHMVMSLRAVGRIDDAKNLAAQIVMEQPADVGKAEIYELLFLMAQLTEDHETRARLMLQALAVDPTRREAFGDLAMSYIVAGDAPAALSMATAMDALPLPDPVPWNTRRKYYGYAGTHILGCALRFNGRMAEADVLEMNRFLLSGAKISLLHATRGRPAMAAATRRKWLETAANPDAIEHIYALDVDDETMGVLAINRHVLLDGTGGSVAAWNKAAESSRGEVLIQLSDDWEPFQGWDAAILDAIGDTTKPAVLAVNDGHRRDNLLCMAILTRARWQQQGYLFHPAFFSVYSDNWFSECAYRDGIVIDARDRITFEHMHPFFGKGEVDATYHRGNSQDAYERGKAVLEELRKQ